MATDVRNGGAGGDGGMAGTQPRSLCGGAGRWWRQASDEGLRNAVAAGREAYDRRRMLPRLIALDPRELEAGGAAFDRSILARLKRALRAERRRGRAGHWTYDLDRHLALLQALAGEEGRAGADRTGGRRAAGPIQAGREHGTKNAARRVGRRS